MLGSAQGDLLCVDLQREIFFVTFCPFHLHKYSYMQSRDSLLICTPRRDAC
jgi:hypothetical protein